MQTLRRIATGLALATVALLMLSAAPLSSSVLADNGDNGNGGLEAVPFTFVGTANQCGGPAGSHIVTSAWLSGFGLPDNGDPSTANDPHSGLLLSKNGPTSDCSAAGATITGIEKDPTVSELGFDYRNGGHCGAGAPRFNITTADGKRYFAGCADGTQTPTPQDPAQWTRVRFADAQIFPATTGDPAFVLGTTKVKSIEIIYDEGTDTPSAQDPMGIGLASIDNIDIGGKLITNGPPGNQRGNSGGSDGGQGGGDGGQGGGDGGGD
ncbi:MAG: hypothetical protein ACYDCQ_04480 [Dehalococcoidia bacterium]